MLLMTAVAVKRGVQSCVALAACEGSDEPEEVLNSLRCIIRSGELIT